MNLAVLVQHHPLRADLLPELLDGLGEATVVTDPEPDGTPSAWRTYREALLSRPPGATHVLVVQDDAVPLAGWRDTAERLIREDEDDALIALFVAGDSYFRRTMREANKRGDTRLPIMPGPYIPTVATVWPAHRIMPFLAWATKRFRPDFKGDDPILGAWGRAEQIPAVASVPCVFDHRHEERSLVKFGRARLRPPRHAAPRPRASRIAAVTPERG